MPRTGRPRRPWAKLHTKLLESSINYEMEPHETLIFIKLILLAADSNNDGLITDNDGLPVPHRHIAHRCYIDLPTLESTLTKLTATSRINENGNGIEITNWKQYQSEYDRQKPYREKNKPETLRDYSQQSRQEIVSSTIEDIERLKKIRGKENG